MARKFLLDVGIVACFIGAIFLVSFVQEVAFAQNTAEKLPVQLLDRPLQVSALKEADEDWIDLQDQFVLVGADYLRVEFDLHGLCPLRGDASALVLDQAEWFYVSLADYMNLADCQPGQQRGVQTVYVPVSHFWNDSKTQQVVPENGISALRLRIWHTLPYTVDILNVFAETYGTC